ncbi:MAG: hypothetical protein IH586_18180, partial [Anaerolineaceae bacterium]|nr:hypothetical protein [Anaerolineaceae bacterium]
ECFIDHSWFGHSVRDLAGVFSASEWEEGRRGVKCKLKAMGPSGPLLEELGRQLTKEEGRQPRVGFSADILFTSQGRKVEKILRVNSVDLVFNPARGGAFLRALNADNGFLSRITRTGKKGEGKMGEQEERSGTAAQLQQDVQALRTILDMQQEQTRLQQEAEAARAVRAEMCGYLLESGLAASKLPRPMTEQVRKQFAGKVFEPGDLTQAIESARELVSQLTGGSVVQGENRISGMFSSEDRLQAAVDDLLGAPRDASMEAAKVERMQGIRELYMTMTGDYDLHGGFYRDRVQLATTADFTGLVKNALNKVIVERWRELGKAGYDWWKKITVQEHMTSLNDITGILVGTVGDLPSVAEGAEYTELAVGDSPETASFTKYGGYIPLTLELIDRDETRKLKEYPRALATAGLRKISALVAAVFTANSGIGPTMADTGALFNATAVTTTGGHANLLTTGLAAAQWEVVSAAMYNQPMLVKNETGLIGVGPKMAINPRYMLVPRALQLTGRKILYPGMENASNITSENQQQGAPGDVITVPEWTDTTDWAAVCDPAIAPAIHVCDRFGLIPEVYIAGDETSGAVFMNDEQRIKVRHFLAVFVADYRPLHKSNVAG